MEISRQLNRMGFHSHAAGSGAEVAEVHSSHVADLREEDIRDIGELARVLEAGR